MEVREPPATYSEYCLLPEGAPRYEILEGVGYLTPSPGSRHQRISRNVVRALDNHVGTRLLGDVYNAPLDVVFSEANVVQPDVLYFGREKAGIVRARGIFGAPDLVVEILSPSTEQRDLQGKLILYRRYGVREYWIVDEKNRTVTVWTGGKSPLDTCRTAAEGDAVPSMILPDLALAVLDLFAGVDEIPEE